MKDSYKQLDEEINMGKEAREWARSVMAVALGVAALLALLWLGCAF
jgi:hypothetical protein